MATSLSHKELIRRYILGENVPAQDSQDDQRPTETIPLSPEDSAVETELDILEQQLYDYTQPQMDLSKLVFLPQAPESQTPSTRLNLDNMLDFFPPALASTKRLSYRIQGYQSLLVRLDELHISSPALDTQRSSLRSIVTRELERLVSAVQAEQDARMGVRAKHENIRIIDPVESRSPSGRIRSPTVTAVIILVAIIHCMMGVARDHCGLILKSFQAILLMSADTQDSRSAQTFASNHIDTIPTTLPTALFYLDLLDPVDLYVVCPNCDAIYKEDQIQEIPDTCTKVDLDGDQCDTELFIHHHRGNRTWRKPRRRFSHQPLESWLVRFLNRPEIEELLEKASPCVNPTCTDVWEAQYLSEFPGVGEPSFFVCPSDELRLAFLVYHDFFNPFANMTAGKKVSTGIVMMVCLNLPPDVRYDLKNIYVTAMIPGPKEPALENINHYMHPIVDNLVEHYENGVYISKTHKFPRGRKVRSAVPINSMDIPASRSFSGLGGVSHTNFCSFCKATLRAIDNFHPTAFEERSVDEHAIHVQRWLQAKSLAEQTSVWLDHGARYSEWLRFGWFNPFRGTTIAPLHWIKNVIEKQVRENMGASTTIRAGIPLTPPLPKAITTLELAWGNLAIKHLSVSEFVQARFPQPLVRFMCRKRGIFEAGHSVARLVENLNEWRINNSVVNLDGSPVSPDPDHLVAEARAEFYLSKLHDPNNTRTFEANVTLAGLRKLSTKYNIPWELKENKKALIIRLIPHRKRAEVEMVPTESSKKQVALLGKEVVAEIRSDIERTALPSWLKNPPPKFASVDHGKLASEQYKSLAMLSLPITLIRLWSDAETALRERLDHFLHLSVAIRILSYQSIDAHDISYFDYHYHQYLTGLKDLYPFNTITPVQHLGLHIPYFLHYLGPSPKYSENTCEMFIGMLEEIPTNSRLGQLEQTLHRELIMTANLKAMLEQDVFPDQLSRFGQIINNFLTHRYPGSERPSSTTWTTTHGSAPMALPLETHTALSTWAHSNNLRTFTRHLHICTKLRRGNVVYQPFTEATGDSFILFIPRGETVPIPGRIDAIMEEPGDAVGHYSTARIVLLVRPFRSLSSTDQAHDPYRHHPIVGKPRLNIMALFYENVNAETVHILEPRDIVSHVATCPFTDPKGTFSEPCIVVVDLNMRHTLHH